MGDGAFAPGWVGFDCVYCLWEFGLPAMAMGIYTSFLVCVHIRCCGHGGYGFRPYSGSLLKSAKVSKTLLPHHSASRLGSVCPSSDIDLGGPQINIG